MSGTAAETTGRRLAKRLAVAVLVLVACKSREEREAAVVIAEAAKRRAEVEATELQSFVAVGLEGGECWNIDDLIGIEVITSGKDPWGNQYVIECSGAEVRVVSVGPDGKLGTEDDIVGRAEKPKEAPVTVTIGEILNGPPKVGGTSIRVQGFVVEGSIKKKKGSKDNYQFVVEQQGQRLLVYFVGIIPDGFREGGEVKLTGRLVDEGRLFAADEVVVVDG